MCNAVKAVCTFYMLLRVQDKPLVTLGDAMSSFLEHQDPTTSDCGPLSKTEFSIGKMWVLSSSGLPETWWAAKNGHHWARAGSTLRWCICLTLCFCTFFTASIILCFITQGSSTWNIGFGSIRLDNLLSSNLAHGLVLAVLLANSPQVLISLIYVFYNSLLTSMLSGAEWASFSTKRQTLRVSEPKGPQRSTYWLQLPYTYGITLIVTICALHYGVSQSLFLVSVVVMNESHLLPISTIRRCGYSGNAMIFSICLGVLLIAALIILAFRKYSPGTPLIGSCSAAISAACHPPPEDTNAALLPLMWGAVKLKPAGVDAPKVLFKNINSGIKDKEGDAGGKHDQSLKQSNQIISAGTDNKPEQTEAIADGLPAELVHYCLTSMEVDPPNFDYDSMKNQPRYGFWV